MYICAYTCKRASSSRSSRIRVPRSQSQPQSQRPRDPLDRWRVPRRQAVRPVRPYLDRGSGPPSREGIMSPPLGGALLSSLTWEPFGVSRSRSSLLRGPRAGCDMQPSPGGFAGSYTAVVTRLKFLPHEESFGVSWSQSQRSAFQLVPQTFSLKLGPVITGVPPLEVAWP